MQYISSKKLAEWLGFDSEAVTRWAKAGQLDKHTRFGTPHHSEAAINAFLAKLALAQGVKPVTVQDFKNGVRLLTTHQVAPLFSITTEVLRSWLAAGALGGFHIAYEWRIPSNIVTERIAALNDYVTREEVMAIFNCSDTLVQQWEQAGLIVRPEERIPCYTRDSVSSQVLRCLPSPNPDLVNRWIFEAAVSSNLPFTTSGACEYLGLHKYTLWDMAKKGEILHLTLSKGKYPKKRYAPVSIERAFLRQPALTPNDIVHIVGGTSAQVSEWLRGPLKCPLHNHRRLEFRSACMVNIIAPLLSPGMTARNWLSGRDMSTSPLITDEEVAARYGVAAAVIGELASSGELLGLRRPDDVWVFGERRLRSCMQRLRLRPKRA